MRTGGAAVVDALQACGVSTVFGIPGTHNLEIYRYLSDSGIRHVTPRHEQGAGYAADGYARASGRPGVCITTSGPGLTNIATAAATAYADSVPMLVIAPGVPRGMVGADSGWLHETRNQQMVMSGLLSSTLRADTASEASAFIRQVFTSWPSQRPRPAYLEIPLDVLEGPWDGADSDAIQPPARHPLSPAAVCAAAAILREGSTAFLVGGGAKDVGSPLVELAERLGSPVVTTVNGKGAFPEAHPLSLGASIRLPAAQDVISNADTALLIGTEVADSDLWGGGLKPKGNLIRIDIDVRQLAKNLDATLQLPGDARDVVALLLGQLHDMPKKPYAELAEITARPRARILADVEAQAAPWIPLHAGLGSCLPEDAIIAGDSSQVSYYGTVHLWPVSSSRRFLYPTGYATLGYGLPAAIGAKIAWPGRPVLALVGDGAFMFSMSEMATAHEQRLGLPVIVVRNGGFGEIRREMDERGITRMGVDLEVPQLRSVARAFGARFSGPLDGYDDLPALLSSAFEARVPTLIEVVIR